MFNSWSIFDVKTVFSCTHCSKCNSPRRYPGSWPRWFLQARCWLGWRTMGTSHHWKGSCIHQQRSCRWHRSWRPGFWKKTEKHISLFRVDCSKYRESRFDDIFGQHVSLNENESVFLHRRSLEQVLRPCEIHQFFVTNLCATEVHRTGSD